MDLKDVHPDLDCNINSDNKLSIRLGMPQDELRANNIQMSAD
jgi:hypothetical protein